MKMIIDANVVAYRINVSPSAPQVSESILENDLLAPAFLKIEFHQILWKHRRLTAFTRERIDRLCSLFEEFPIEYVADAGLIAPALDLALAHEMTLYDALYAALAKREAAPLVTADKTLAQKAETAGVDVVLIR